MFKKFCNRNQLILSPKQKEDWGRLRKRRENWPIGVYFVPGRRRGWLLFVLLVLDAQPNIYWWADKDARNSTGFWLKIIAFRVFFLNYSSGQFIIHRPKLQATAEGTFNLTTETSKSCDQIANLRNVAENSRTLKLFNYLRVTSRWTLGLHFDSFTEIYR